MASGRELSPIDANRQRERQGNNVDRGLHGSACNLHIFSHTHYLAVFSAEFDTAMLLTMPPDHNSGSSPEPWGGSSWTERARTLAQRMRHDLRLAIVTLYSLCALITIGPFAVYRLTNGDLAIGLADSLIVLCFLGLAVLAWHPAWTRRIANLLAVVAASGAAFMVLGLGLSPMWIFSTLVGNFLMAERRIALTVNAAMVVVVALQPGIFASGAEHATFIAVSLMNSLFSMIFASGMIVQHNQLTELATRDGLTGAFNRRSLDQDLARLTSSRTGKPHSLILFDLDDFKRLNDDRGHEAGDTVLKALARAADRSTREGDRFYRYGGEEFVLLLPDTALSGAEVAYTNLSGEFEQALLGERPTTTFSAGMAQHTAGELPDAWLARADRALTQAKRAGKNCYRVSSSPDRAIT
jgi:diguanylate cyclase (GGDEF)-like protein